MTLIAIVVTLMLYCFVNFRYNRIKVCRSENPF